jgi:thiosulfate dehydrogenase
MKDKITSAIFIIIVFAVIGGVVSLLFRNFISFSPIGAIERPGAKEKAPEAAIAFNPPAPEDAPPGIKDAVMLGYHIMTETRKYVPKYVGNKLTCSNCHFKGGMTEGGRNGGLSLVGVGATYPEYKKRENYAVDLATRTNDCFQRSMNGSPLPGDSKEMNAMITYYQWISKGLPIYGEIPWLGLKSLKSEHAPDTNRGKQLFAQKCAACHGDHGQGTQIAPPLWGPESFNDGAGMHKPENFAAFSHGNMPFQNPDMSDAEALDVAAFVTSRPRPHFVAEGQKRH